jgi:hypothetical protein
MGNLVLTLWRPVNRNQCPERAGQKNPLPLYLSDCVAPASAAGARPDGTDGKNSLFQLGSTDPKIKTQGGKKTMKQKMLALAAVAILLLTLAAGCGGSSSSGSSSGGSSGGGTTSGNVSASAE